MNETVVKKEQKTNALTLTIKDKLLLHSSYMPFIKRGGLFLPTSRYLEVGQKVFLLIKFLDDVEKLPISGVVIWVTPENALNNKPKGIGFQFDAADNDHAKLKIESHLKGSEKSKKITFTL